MLLVGEPADPNSDLLGNALAAADHDGGHVDDLAITGWASDAGGVRSGQTWLSSARSPPPVRRQIQT
jgi:hypothetical protein